MMLRNFHHFLYKKAIFYIKNAKSSGNHVEKKSDSRSPIRITFKFELIIKQHIALMYFHEIGYGTFWINN